MILAKEALVWRGGWFERTPERSGGAIEIVSMFTSSKELCGKAMKILGVEGGRVVRSRKSYR